MESSTRNTSSKLRPVLMGYTNISFIFLSGPTTNTVRTVALFAAVRPSDVLPASDGEHVIQLRHLEFRIANHGIRDFVALRLFNIGRPFAVICDRIDA